VYPPQRVHVEGVFVTSTSAEETSVIEKTLKKEGPRKEDKRNQERKVTITAPAWLWVVA